jgi:hypothetical protein
MNDRPDALELLRAVNHTLAQEILPTATAEQLYTLRMIANALGIAIRELEAQDVDAASEAQGLGRLYGETREINGLSMNNRQFAADIRSGRFEADGKQESDVRQHLLAVARAKLAAAYPKGLASMARNK